MANTIPNTINTTVVLGSANYPGPLTITSTGGIDAGTGAAALTIATAGAVLNNGVIIGGSGAVPTYSDHYNGNTGAVGVQISTGTLTNTGRVIGGTGSVVNNYESGTAGTGGVGLVQTGGTVLNSGTITGGTGGSGNAFGVHLYGPNGGNGGYGVALNGGTFVNTGAIVGGVGGAGVPGGAASWGANYIPANGATGGGVSITSGLFIDNGLITGTKAIMFSGTASATLLVESGASFTGKVLANGDASATLAIGGTTPFQLSGIDSAGGSGTFLGFTNLAFASPLGGFGLTGNTAALASGQSIAGFISGDTIGLTGFAATSESWTAGKLTLANGTATQTIAISASADQFAVLDDGSNSNILLAPSSISLAGGNFVLSGHYTGLTGSITGFDAGDTINLEGFAASSISYVSGTGLVLNNGVTTETLHLAPPASGFLTITTDGTNTTIKDAAPIPFFTSSISPGVTMDGAISPYHTTLTVTGSGAITGAAGVNQTGTNAGDGNAGGAGGAGITGGTSDTITNQGAVTGGAGGNGQGASYSGGVGGDGGDGADNLADGTLKNTGTITGGTGGAGGTTYVTTAGAGGKGGTGVSITGGETVINSGTIAGGAGGSAGHYTFSGGQPAGGAGGAGGTGLIVNASSADNSGLITGGAGQTGAPSRATSSGAQGAGGTGLYVTGGSVLTNSGTIVGGAAGSVGGAGGYGSQSAPGTGGAGILLNGATLFNAGSIAGGSGADAVKFGTAAGTLVVEAGAHFTGAVEANAAAVDWLEFASGSSLSLGSSFTGFTQTEILSAAAVTLSGTLGNAVENDGTIITPDGISLVITGALTGTGVIIDDPSTIVLDGSVSSGQTISFAGPGGVIELGDPTQFDGTIAGMAPGGTLLIDGFTASSSSYAAGQLVLNGTGSASTPETITIAIAGSFSSSGFSFSSNGAGGTDIVACFMHDTQILTVNGEVAAADLRTGDMVVTANGAMPVRWVGQSPISTRFADKLRVLPIRIMAGTLGEGLPRRDLRLSPDHALLISGVLVQAGALVNNVTIIRDDTVPEQFTYYHVELASHELLLAEGVAVESFVDNVDRMNFANWAEHEALADAGPIVEMPYPRAKSARQVPKRIRRDVAARAAAEADQAA